MKNPDWGHVLPDGTVIPLEDLDTAVVAWKDFTAPLTDACGLELWSAPPETTPALDVLPGFGVRLMDKGLGIQTHFAADHVRKLNTAMGKDEWGNWKKSRDKKRRPKRKTVGN